MMKAGVSIDMLRKSDCVLGSWLLCSLSSEEGFSKMFGIPADVARSIEPTSIEIPVDMAIALNQKMIDSGHRVNERLRLNEYLVARDFEMIMLVSQPAYRPD